MADADAFYGYGNALVGPSGISAAWPTAVGYGHQSTVYGARGHYYGKRSADADAYYGYGNALVGPSGVSAAWPTAVGYGHQSTVYGARGHYLGKRSADAYYGYGYAAHPGVATSYVARSPQGLHGVV